MGDVVIRLVHACGMPEIAADLRWSDGVASAARAALGAGAPVICDAQMVADGVIAARLPAENQILSMIRLPNLVALAREQGTTRSAAQVELWKPFLPGSVVAIGNAPTALFRLLEVLSLIHISEPTRRRGISYAVFCLKKKKRKEKEEVRRGGGGGGGVFFFF